MARQVEEFEFAPDDLGALVDAMRRLSGAEDGWINLLPGVPAELAEEERAPSVLSALFGARTVPVTMATWTPTGRRRSGRAERTIGLLHGRGRRAVHQLQGPGVEVPVGWIVRQDHPRRGLVLAVPAATPHEEVARWLLRAGERLAAVPLTGRWRARVYLPRSTTS